MTKVISFSVPDYIYDKYLREYEGNRSKYIEGMLIRGIEAESGEIKDKSNRLIEALRSIREKEEEIRKLKGKLARSTGGEQAVMLNCASCNSFLSGKSYEVGEKKMCGACYMRFVASNKTEVKQHDN